MRGDPIFVGGMYKSGTSLLRAMLGRHSRLFAGLETQWLYESWAGLPDRRRWLARLSAFFDVPPAELEIACGDTLDVGGALDLLMAALADRAQKPRWIEKTPGNVGVIARILRSWPSARILHLIRDPRDVYASQVESGKWAAPEEFAPRWCGTVGAGRDWLAAVGGAHPAYLEVRYERLVLGPVDATRDILAFLGEPWEAQVAEFPGQAADFDKVRAATGKASTSLRRLAEPLSASRVGLWRSVLAPGQWEPVRRAIERRGYGPLVDSLVAETDERAAPPRRAGAGMP